MSRTLVVTNDFPPRVGGIESFVAEVCRILDEDVVVLTSHEPGDRAHDARLRFPVVRHSGLLLPTPATARLAAHLLSEHGATRVLFGAAMPLGLLAPGLRRVGARRLVALTHGHEVWWARLPVSRVALRRVAASVDHLGVISDHTRAAIAPALAPADRAKLVPLPPPVRLDRAAPPGTTRVPGRCVAVGRLVRQKNHAVLLRAWAAMPTRAGRELLVVGDGPGRHRLERIVDRLGIAGSVHFLGAVPHERVHALLASAQVFALPVRTRFAGLNPEGLGLGFCEAAAAGLPVVVGRSGGAPETVLDGVSGHVVDPDDVDDIAERLQTLLADPSRAAAMGAAGAAHVRRFGAEVVGAGLRRALDLPVP